MDKEKKSGPQKGAERIEDRPQEQREKPATPRQEPEKRPRKRKVPIVEEKPTRSAPAGKKAKSGENGKKRRGPQGSGEEKDREIEGAKSLQAGGNREGAGVEGEGLRDGAKSLQKGGNIQGGGEGGGRAFEHLDDAKKRRVLQHYINTGGQVGKACRMAGISHQTHYNWLAADPDYKAAYLEAQERSLDVIEQEIIRRGVKGFKEPIIYQGKITGHVRRYSDNLLMFLAKRRDPLYRDNPQLALGLKAAGDIKISLSIPRPEGDVIDAESREISNSANSGKADT